MHVYNGSNPITNPGYVYDAAGNVLMDNVNCYSSDSENRLVSTVPMTLGGVCAAPGTGQPGTLEGMSYVYDPDGRRVVRLHNGAIVEQDYYDAAGHLITTTDGNGNPLRAEIYAGNRHLATWNPAGGGTTYFNHADWLGTERARTNSSGTVCESITSLPFGDGQNISGNCGAGDSSPNHFTGKERDSESGLDHFGERYDASSLGRFMSPDPLASSARPMEPQTWNRYAYVHNNPLAFADFEGLVDYFVFRPLAKGDGRAWTAIKNEARPGDHVITYNGEAASAKQFNTALESKDAVVVFAGHTVHNQAEVTGAVLLGGNTPVGNPNVVAGSADAQGVFDQATVAVSGDVKANSVALFGCNSQDLAGQYSNTNFTGTAPDTNTAAEDAGGAAYTDTLVRGGDLGAATKSAATAMGATTEKANQNLPKGQPPYKSPTVCTTKPDGTTECQK